MNEIEKNSYYWKISKKIISINTVSHLENIECAAILSEELKQFGFEVFLQKYQDEQGRNKAQIIAKIGPDVSGVLILSGHIYTVPFANQPGW